MTFDSSHKLTVGQGGRLTLGLVKEIKEQDHGKTNHQPHRKIFIKSIQLFLRNS